MPQAEAVKPIIVTARQLFNAFDANEVAAEQEFKGKPVLITGPVASIDTGMMGGVTVVLSAGGDFDQVMLTGIDRDSAAKLGKGQKITASCIGGVAVLKTPSLNSCALQ